MSNDHDYLQHDRDTEAAWRRNGKHTPETGQERPFFPPQKQKQFDAWCAANPWAPFEEIDAQIKDLERYDDEPQGWHIVLFWDDARTGDMMWDGELWMADRNTNWDFARGKPIHVPEGGYILTSHHIPPQLMPGY